VGIAVIPAPAFAGINLVPAKAGTYCESRNLLSPLWRINFSRDPLLQRESIF